MMNRYLMNLSVFVSVKFTMILNGRFYYCIITIAIQRKLKLAKQNPFFSTLDTIYIPFKI